MKAMSLGAGRVDEALRVVRALGAHRYVAGRLHLVHAFALDALPATATETEQARAWAAETLRDTTVDPSSRDERLWRRCSDAEVVAVLDAFWTPGATRRDTRITLERVLARHDLPVPSHSPFDESGEDEMHPLLVDAGWELLSLAQLDADRHRGAIAAFGDWLGFESARFEEETSIPPTVHLYELPALGPVELLGGANDDGLLLEPLVAWVEGNETYLDYVLRGVRRAAKLPERDAED
jgi:hypothetical protein